MNNLFTKDGSLNGRSRKLTAKEFFKENDAKGYFTKPDFITYVSKLTRNEPEDFVGFIKELNAGSKLNFKLQVREDKDNRKYVWVEFLFAKGSKGFKIVVDSDIIRFVEEYAIGMIKIDFTIDELSHEALNS